MSTNKDETLKQFCDVTGADESRCKFFLESSNWQLDVALSSFYENGGNADEAPAANPTAIVSSLPTLSDSDMDSPPRSPLQTQKKDKKKVPTAKFATLDTLRQDSSSDEEEVPLTTESPKITAESAYSALCCNWIARHFQFVVQDIFNRDPDTSNNEPLNDANGQNGDNVPKTIGPKRHNIDIKSSDDSGTKEELRTLKIEIERLLSENCKLRAEIARLKEENDKASHSQAQAGQAFYAGGSERSGQQIIGPGKGRKDIVSEVFKSVRERGAVVFEDEPSSTSRGRSVFGGVGYRLGQTSDEPIAGGEQPQQQQQQQQQQAGQPNAPRSVRLRLYREGFTVDQGALRSYTDPDHAEFLNCIRSGLIPPELSAAGGEVRVSLEDRRHEECPRNVPKAQAFAGKGHLLGSPTPVTVGATGGDGTAPSERAANLRAAQDQVRLDAAGPTTTIQFRLADGSRLTGRFNHSHTVADLHEYVSRAEPSYQLQNFSLLTTFPSAELSDPGATLAQANILNTTLLQRLK